MKVFVNLIFVLITCFFVACNTCDEDHCKRTLQNSIEVRFNMDSLNGGFTKAQFMNVTITNSNIYTWAGSDPYSFFIMSGGNNVYHGSLIITNTSTSTQNSFTNFQFTTDKPDCCPALQNHFITSFLFNGNSISMDPASTKLFIIENN
jgi:hypothetical protein